MRSSAVPAASTQPAHLRAALPKPRQPPQGGHDVSQVVESAHGMALQSAQIISKLFVDGKTSRLGGPRACRAACLPACPPVFGELPPPSS